MSESKPLPVVDYLKIPDDGEPYLEGYRCKKCGSTYLGERTVCSKCFARNEMEVIKLSETGSDVKPVGSSGGSVLPIA